MRPTAYLPIALGGAAMLAIGMGIARFAYTPILPVMREQTGLDVATAAWLATANYAGYLAGALWPMAAARLRWRLPVSVMLGMALAAALGATLAMAAVDSVLPWLTLRFIAGVAGAWLMIYASALVLDAGAKPGADGALLLGVHYAGVGCGIVCSGLLVAWLARIDVGWRLLWLAHAALIAALLPLAAIALRAGRAADASAPPMHASNTRAHETSAGAGWLIGAYFCAGLGYIVSATFLPTLAAQQPALAPYAFFGWIVVGAAAIPSNVFWTRVMARIGHGAAFTLAMATQAIGVALPALFGSPAALLASAAILGATFMGIVAIANARARLLAPQRTAHIVAAMTAAYGAGQIIGPLVAGALAQRGGQFAPGLWIATAALVAGIGLFRIGERRRNIR